MLGYILLALVTLFFAVILIRAAMFRPKAQPVVEAEKVEFDEQAAVDALAALIRCKTVSYHDHSLEDDAEFEKMIVRIAEIWNI